MQMLKPLYRIAAISATLLFALAACATAEPDPDATIAYREPPPDPNEVICKRQRPIGSHIPVRVCRTRAQIEEEREAALRSAGPLRTMGGRHPPPSPTPP